MYYVVYLIGLIITAVIITETNGAESIHEAAFIVLFWPVCLMISIVKSILIGGKEYFKGVFK